jgi:hypothetical protein
MNFGDFNLEFIPAAGSNPNSIYRFSRDTDGFSVAIGPDDKVMLGLIKTNEGDSHVVRSINLGSIRPEDVPEITELFIRYSQSGIPLEKIFEMVEETENQLTKAHFEKLFEDLKK